jgi:PAS domain S-box-containing protein
MTKNELERTAALVEALPYEQIVENAPDAIVIVDGDGAIVLANAQVEALFGFPRAELLGQKIEILLPDRYRAGHVGLRSGYASSPRIRAMGTGEVLHGRRNDGSEFPVEIALSPVRTPAGVLTSAAIRDITDRRRIETAARVTAERLSSAVESFQDGFAVYDAEDRLLLCNSVFRRVIGETFAGPVQGAAFEEILRAEVELYDTSEEGPEALAARRLAHHREARGAIEVRTRDGRTFRVVARATPEGGRITTVYDLTDDATRSAELVEARRAAETANTAKSEFLRSMSHELRTPLNAILGFAQLLQRDRTLPERPVRLVEHVLRGGEHLLRLIDDVLDLARVEAGSVLLSPEPVVLGEVLEGVRQTLAPLAQKKGMRLEIAPIDGSLPPALADRTRVTQVVLNFGSNAIKYGRIGGKLVIRVSARGEKVRIAVSDDGPGVAVDKQDRLFQPFYRAGQETGPIEGTGIGLALTRRLAQLMGGEVGFASDPGVETTFWIDLPLHLQPAPTSGLSTTARTQPGDGLGSRPGAPFLVLYVEDNPANVVFMEELLAGFDGVRLMTAPTGELALELLREHRPAVILLDINLPGMSGFDVLKQVRHDPGTQGIPVIALSASAMDRDLKRAEDAGFARYLTKPVNVDVLLSTLERFLGTQPATTPSSAPEP